MAQTRKLPIRPDKRQIRKEAVTYELARQPSSSSCPAPSDIVLYTVFEYAPQNSAQSLCIADS